MKNPIVFTSFRTDTSIGGVEPKIILTDTDGCEFICKSVSTLYAASSVIAAKVLKLLIPEFPIFDYLSIDQKEILAQTKVDLIDIRSYSYYSAKVRFYDLSEAIRNYYKQELIGCFGIALHDAKAFRELRLKFLETSRTMQEALSLKPRNLEHIRQLQNYMSEYIKGIISLSSQDFQRKFYKAVAFAHYLSIGDFLNRKGYNTGIMIKENGDFDIISIDLDMALFASLKNTFKSKLPEILGSDALAINELAFNQRLHLLPQANTFIQGGPSNKSCEQLYEEILFNASRRNPYIDSILRKNRGVSESYSYYLEGVWSILQITDQQLENILNVVPQQEYELLDRLSEKLPYSNKSFQENIYTFLSERREKFREYFGPEIIVKTDARQI